MSSSLHPPASTGPVAIRASIVRGGSSKAVMLLAAELPADPARRDRVILSIFGSPDARQIDGLGGADPLTSKVAIIAPSSRDDADVDYTFGYVGIERAGVDWEGNCGNISIAVGPFAVDEGLVPAVEPLTRVRIYNTNTQKVIEADVPVRDGKSWSEGDFVHPGVPTAGAPIFMNFVNAAGSKTGRLLPTGRAVDEIRLSDGRVIRATLFDAAAPAIFVKASDIGLSGTELPAEAAGRPEMLETMEKLRTAGAVMMGLAADPSAVSPAIPKVAFVGPAQSYRTMQGDIISAAECDLVARTKALGVLHKAYAVTGGICLSAAALVEGTVVNEVLSPRGAGNDAIRIGHPTGVSTFFASVEIVGGAPHLARAAIAGTARRIMDGRVYVPRRIYDENAQ